MPMGVLQFDHRKIHLGNQRPSRVLRVGPHAPPGFLAARLKERGAAGTPDLCPRGGAGPLGGPRPTQRGGHLK
jgi:hypothetical protein